MIYIWFPNHDVGNMMSLFWWWVMVNAHGNRQITILDKQHTHPMLLRLPSIITNCGPFSFWFEPVTCWYYSPVELLQCAGPIMQQSYTSCDHTTTSQVDVAIHFRCSDVPFILHPDYRLLLDAYYQRAADIIYQTCPVLIRRVGILHFAGHKTRGSATAINAYVDHLVCLTRSLFPCTTVELLAQSPCCDFKTMQTASALIGSISSFCFFAGISSTGIVILPTSLNEPLVMNTHFFLPINQFALNHRDVHGKYEDTQQVIHQLMNQSLI